ncbi:hypothetical protein [Chryseobacterium indoltheticum]|uniref:hypothetical protein n=1 Tax=Chryseobacterium indoltheticum TaxID=254 RepID=UPI003F49ADAE
MIFESEIPIKWIDGFSKLNILRLEEIEYFILKEKISKFNKKYKELINRDFDELVLNYLIGNIKSTVVLSGSFVELILTFYLERKKLKIFHIYKMEEPLIGIYMIPLSMI